MATAGVVAAAPAAFAAETEIQRLIREHEDIAEDLAEKVATNKTLIFAFARDFVAGFGSNFEPPPALALCFRDAP